MASGFQSTTQITGGTVPSPRTEQGRAFLQQRIALFARMMFSIVLAYVVVIITTRTLVPELRSKSEAMGIWLAASAVVLLGAVWLFARGRPRSAWVLSALDVETQVVFGTLVGLGTHLNTELPPVVYGGFIGVTFMIFGRVLLIPTTVRRTFLISTAAMLPMVAGTASFAFRTEAETYFPPYVMSLIGVIWASIAVAIATIGTRVIYGLREEAREARQLGQYTLMRKLGEGGMGAVYLARHSMLRRPTAIKLLPLDKAGEQALQRFEREVQLTSELTHPNTVSIYDYGRSPNGVFYYVMEYLDGIDLESLVRSHGAQPAARVVHVLRQVCGALIEAHGRGLIHRDVKPANIILCMRGGVPDVAKVVDFGLVKDLEQGDVNLTAANVVAGTPAYLSPEAVTDPQLVDAASDLYAVGAVAYFLLTGRVVFEGKTVVEVCSHHLHTSPIPPSERVGKPIAPDLEQLVLQCLAKDRAKRPASARALQSALARIAAALPWDEANAREWWRRFDAERTEADADAEPEAISSPLVTIDLRDRLGLGA